MNNTIEANTLREWLETHRPVTVLDVRNDEDRAQWTIPGSLHVNAYEALRAGQPGALASAILPHDQPVVTVCNAGRVSQTAAAILADRGFDARSLVGGMKAWSLAWNTAEITLEDSTVQMIQVRRTGKGCLPYLAASGNEAAVIDPSLPAEVYADLAHRRECRSRHSSNASLRNFHPLRPTSFASSS